MKLVVDTKSFVDGVNWVTKPLDTKNDQAHIALVVDANGNGYLAYSNDSSYTESPITVEKIELEDGETEVKLAMSALYVRRLASTLRNLEKPITLSKDLSSPGTSLAVKRSFENYTLPVLEARIAAKPAYEVIGTAADGEFFDTINRLAKLTDPQNAGVLPVLGTVDVHLDPEEKSITIMATDRYALGEIVVPFAPVADAEFYGDNRHLLVPAARAAMIAPSKGAVDTLDLVFESKGQKFGYSFPDGRVAIFALDTAEPLAYSVIKVNSSNTSQSVLLNGVEFKNALGTIAALALDESNFQLSFSADSLVVSDVHSKNTVRVAVDNVEGVEETQVVRFSRDILNEALGPITTSRFNLKWKDESSAFILEPVFDDDSVAANVFLLAIPESS